MFNDNTSSSVEKLKRLVESRFGKSLLIRQLVDTDANNNCEAKLRGSDLHIPIHVNGSLYGTAVVTSAKDLEEQKMKDLEQVVRLVLEPTLYNWHLERKEKNLESLSKLSFERDNLKLFAEELPAEEIAEAFADESPQLVYNYIHLLGKNALLSKKISMRINDICQRFAMVPFADISGQIANVLELCKLGSITLYIEEISTLSAQDQDLIMEYLESPRSSEEPLIISASALTMDELEQSALHPHLLDEVIVSTLETDKIPLDSHNLNEVLEILFLKDKNA